MPVKQTKQASTKQASTKAGGARKGKKSQKKSTARASKAKPRSKKSKKQKGGKQKGGKCHYVTIKGMNVNSLSLPEQYARVSDCTDASEASPTAHPNLI